MADGTAGADQASNRDASRPRVRVQQLRPTNKDAVLNAPVKPPQAAVPDTSKTSTTSANATPAPAPAQPRVIVPRVVTGVGSGSTILVNNCQVRRQSAFRRKDQFAEEEP